MNLINSVIIDKGRRVWKSRSFRVFTCESYFTWPMEEFKAFRLLWKTGYFFISLLKFGIVIVRW